VPNRVHPGEKAAEITHLAGTIHPGGGGRGPGPGYAHTVTSRSSRGRWQRVLEARKQARVSLGRNPDASDSYGPPKVRTKLPVAPELPRVKYGPGIGVLSLGEASQRLGLSRAQLEAMIDAGTIEALPTGYTRMIPTREIERLKATRPTTE